MTGYLTDAGVALGAFFRGDKEALVCFCYFALHLLLFVTGAFLGAFSFRWLDVYAAMAAGFLQLFAGSVYFLSRHFGRKQDKHV